MNHAPRHLDELEHRSHVAPTPHRNGTSKEVLRAQYARARETVTAALAAYSGLSFNALDYTSTDAFSAARQAHRARVAELIAMRQDLDIVLNVLAT